MGYKRIHVRVPFVADATLLGKTKGGIKARTVDISEGGFCITEPSDVLAESSYHITITTAGGDRFEMYARLVRQDGNKAGFQTLEMDSRAREVITLLVAEYQMTPEFIRQLDEFELLNQRFVDEQGNELEISFDDDDGGD